MLFALLTTTLFCACGSMGRPDVIYLARHGQTEWNRVSRFQGDPDLDPVGHLNRVSLWRLLRKEPLHAIYTSELLRTRRTAELVAKEHKLPIKVQRSLNEMSPGVFEGTCFGQLVGPEHSKRSDEACAVQVRGSRPDETIQWMRGELAKIWKQRLTGRLPQGENYDDLVRRVRPFVAELDRGWSGRRVLIIGHGVINRVLLHRLMGWPLQFVAHLRQENDQVFKITRADSGRPELALFTPGVGWKRCSAPKVGQSHLDCNPGPADPREQRPPSGGAAQTPSGTATPPVAPSPQSPVQPSK
jgi:broad specificity phosphatase PhoE